MQTFYHYCLLPVACCLKRSVVRLVRRPGGQVLFDDQVDLIREYRLEVIFGTACNVCFILSLLGKICRDKYHGSRTVHLAKSPGAFNSVYKRHQKIHEYKIKMSPANGYGINKLFAVTVYGYLCAGLPEKSLIVLQ